MPAWRTTARRRLAAVHTPMTDLAAIGSVGLEPSLVSSCLGIFSAIECTLKSCVALTPCAAAIAAEVQVLERPQVAQVEDRAEVDVEALEPLPGEHGVAAGDLVDGLRRQRSRSCGVEPGPMLHGGQARLVASTLRWPFSTRVTE